MGPSGSRWHFGSVMATESPNFISIFISNY